MYACIFLQEEKTKAKKHKKEKKKKKKHKKEKKHKHKSKSNKDESSSSDEVCINLPGQDFIKYKSLLDRKDPCLYMCNWPRNMNTGQNMR